MFVDSNQTNLRYDMNKVAKTHMLSKLDWIAQMMEEYDVVSIKTVCDSIYALFEAVNWCIFMADNNGSSVALLFLASVPVDSAHPRCLPSPTFSTFSLKKELFLQGHFWRQDSLGQLSLYNSVFVQFRHRVYVSFYNRIQFACVSNLSSTRFTNSIG